MSLGLLKVSPCETAVFPATVASWDQVLSVREAPGDDLQWNRRYINKDKLNLIEEWTVGWHYVIVVLDLIRCGTI